MRARVKLTYLTPFFLSYIYRAHVRSNDEDRRVLGDGNFGEIAPRFSHDAVYDYCLYL